MALAPTGQSLTDLQDSVGGIHITVTYHSHQLRGNVLPHQGPHELSSSFLPEGGSLTPVRESPCTPRLRPVSSYGNIRAVTTARSLNKSLQNLSLTEECEMLGPGLEGVVVAVSSGTSEQVAALLCHHCVPRCPVVAVWLLRWP